MLISFWMQNPLFYCYNFLKESAHSFNLNQSYHFCPHTLNKFKNMCGITGQSGNEEGRAEVLGDFLGSAEVKLQLIGESN